MPDADRLAGILGDWYERRDHGEAVDARSRTAAHLRRPLESFARPGGR